MEYFLACGIKENVVPNFLKFKKLIHFLSVPERESTAEIMGCCRKPGLLPMLLVPYVIQYNEGPFTQSSWFLSFSLLSFFPDYTACLQGILNYASSVE